MNQEKHLSKEELDRIKRQKLINGWNQLALKNACIFIAGIGALGCEISKDLALMGVGKLILCDMDKIETSNLSRQMLFYKGDEGKFKADIAKSRLQLMNPFIDIEVFTIPLQQVPLEKYRECDVIVMALDNVKARMDLNKICLKLGLPCVEGGTVGFEGHVQVIIPESSHDIHNSPIKYGNLDYIIDSKTEELSRELDEKKEKAYFKALREIKNLETKIEQIKSTQIDPILNRLRDQVRLEVEKNPEKYLNHTPCYRCVVPIAPPPQKQIAACTLKGIPRTREHCAIRGEVKFIKKFDREPNPDLFNEMKETCAFAQEELVQLRSRVLEESIPPENKETITEAEIEELKQNIFESFGGDFSVDDVENILGNRIPAVQSVNAIISAIQSQEILKLIFLRKGISIGEVMNPPYLNYNGLFGQFDAVTIFRREDCVACGTLQQQENVQVVIAQDATIGDIFKALNQLKTEISIETWMITHPITKQIIYNPLFEAGRTQNKTIIESKINPNDELTFTPIGKTKEGTEVKQYNVIVQIL